MTHVITESTVRYVLSINDINTSISMEIQDAASGEEYDSIYLQDQLELMQCLGNNWRDLEPVTIIRILRQFWI